MEKIPNDITIDNYQYKYNNELSNEYYSYTCKYRTIRKILIKINKDNLVKLKENSTDNIDYTITSREKIHKCNKKIDIDEERKRADDEFIKKQKITELAKNLIFINIQKPLSFHIDNLAKNNIILTKYQIKNILQNIREESFPSNDKFLKDISLIKLSLGDSSELKNIPFCYRYVNCINKYKNKIKLNK